MGLWNLLPEVFEECCTEAAAHPRVPEFKQYMLQRPDGPPREWAEQDMCDPQGAPDEDLADFCIWLAREADEQDRSWMKNCITCVKLYETV